MTVNKNQVLNTVIGVIAATLILEAYEKYVKPKISSEVSGFESLDYIN